MERMRSHPMALTRAFLDNPALDSSRLYYSIELFAEVGTCATSQGREHKFLVIRDCLFCQPILEVRVQTDARHLLLLALMKPDQSVFHVDSAPFQIGNVLKPDS